MLPLRLQPSTVTILRASFATLFPAPTTTLQWPLPMNYYQPQNLAVGTADTCAMVVQPLQSLLLAN